MPEPTDDELGIPEGLDPNIRAELRASRIAKGEAADSEARAVAAERELAFAKAGIPETGAGEWFRKGYDGPTTDPEALKAAFAAAGLGGAVVDDQAAAEAAQHQADLEAAARVQAGGSGAAPFSPDAKASFVQKVQSAKSATEVWHLIDTEGPAAGVRRLIQGETH